MDDDDTRARKKRGNDFKRGVFGGGANESDEARFDVGQKSVLLSFVETVNFVHKKDGADFEIPVGFSALNYGFNVTFFGGNGGDFDEVGIELVSEDAGESGFASTRRAPENEIDRFAFFDDFGEDFAITNYFVLT